MFHCGYLLELTGHVLNCVTMPPSGGLTSETLFLSFVFPRNYPSMPHKTQFLPPAFYSELTMSVLFHFFQLYLDCKSRGVDVFLANCTGKSVASANMK